MLCKSLKEGMLLTITNPERRGWFNHKAQQRLERKYGPMPPKFVIGPDVISLVMRLDGIETFVNPGESFIYLGKKKLQEKSGKSKTIRLVFAKGKVGFIEGRDARYLEPA